MINGYVRPEDNHINNGKPNHSNMDCIVLRSIRQKGSPIRDVGPTARLRSLSASPLTHMGHIKSQAGKDFFENPSTIYPRPRANQGAQFSLSSNFFFSGMSPDCQ
jgi:hypothetical protein